MLSWDLSVQKDFRLMKEGRRLQFRTDFLNIMNHANFDAPNAVLSSPSTMGRVTSTVGSARIIQLALRVVY